MLLRELPPTVELVALSDCNLDRAESLISLYKLNPTGVPLFQDYRSVLDHPDVDAVVVATGEFQRALPCIHACQAGKDVYAEKPLGLSVREGRAIVNAARKYGRIVQVGTQQRSMEINRRACEFIRSGRLGKVLGVKAINYAGPQLAKPTTFAQVIPDRLDWNTWLNQAAWRDFNGEWTNGWKLWRDFSGGEMTDWGSHGIDQIQWALGTDETGPVEIAPLEGGPMGAVSVRYANGVKVEFTIPMGQGPMGGAIFTCEHGKVEINRNRMTSNPPEIAAQVLKDIDMRHEARWEDGKLLWQARGHIENWVDCIRSRKPPHADVEIGHRSVTIGHLANIARELGRPLKWDPKREACNGDDEANQQLERPRRKGFELPEV
jgi:predicted dehydrogenase